MKSTRTRRPWRRTDPQYAYLFKPGTYGTAETPLQIKVGYYTEIAGLGASPTDVVINGKVEVHNRCLADGGTGNCLALVNFWRTIPNLTININAAGQDGCRGSANFWAVSRGVTWANGMTPGRTIPISDFFVAKPSDSVREINSQLARGKHLLLTPGGYDVARSIEVKWPNQVVLGLGHATLTAVDGAIPLEVGDVPGTVIAGVTIDAGPKESPVLLKVGEKRWWSWSSPHNPTTLSDVYFRVGGPHVGKTDTALEVNSDNVLIDHTWVWRADHGVEGFTDTQRWQTNTGRKGAVINGDYITRYPAP